jgi:hypothetical protein
MDSGILPIGTMRSNETLLLAARGGVRQVVAVLAHVARPAAFCWMRCSRTLGVSLTRPHWRFKPRT